MFSLLIVVITCIYLAFTLVEILIGFSLLKNLSRQKKLDEKQPSVSIIFSALNEEQCIEDTIHTLQKLDYTDFEIIAINDRSTDDTGKILNRLQTQYANLHVVHIDKLPPAWMGKNHALQIGANKATGEWLLFTDADVLMQPDTLSKAIAYVIENKIDHLTMLERHIRQTFWLRILLLAHYTTYSIVIKPWRIRFTWSKKSLGHGAFNLVKHDVYKKCGGHAKIRLECFDDMKLGALIKRNGYKQDTADGCDLIKRKWYTSLPDMILGWEKNCFALYNYRVLPLMFDSIFAIFLFLWPLAGVVIFSGVIFWLNAVAIGLTFLISVVASRQYRLEKRYAVFYPIAIMILLYALWNSMVKVKKSKGVNWRGTHYSLNELKSVNFLSLQVKEGDSD